MSATKGRKRVSTKGGASNAELKLGEEVLKANADTYNANYAVNRDAHSAYGAVIKRNREQVKAHYDPTAPRTPGTEVMDHLSSPTMFLVHKDDASGEYSVPMSTDDKEDKQRVFSDPVALLLATNSNFRDAVSGPVSKFDDHMSRDAFEMRILTSQSMTGYHAEEGKYTLNTIADKQQKYYDRVLANNSVDGGGRSKMRGGDDPIVIPELNPKTDEYKKLQKVITEHDKRDIFTALPENVIRMSLLEDVLMIEDEAGSVPKVQITTAPFNIASGPILFYNPLCPNCRSLAPMYIAMARMLNGKCPVGVVDCLDRMNGNDILKDYLGISGYPVIKVYSKGKFIDYTGGADLKKLMSFICVSTGVCLE